MYTLDSGRILTKSIIIVCLLNLLAWKASWAHRTGETGEKKIMIKLKKSRSKRRAPVSSADIIKIKPYFNKDFLCHSLTFLLFLLIVNTKCCLKSVLFQR